MSRFSVARSRWIMGHQLREEPGFLPDYVRWAVGDPGLASSHCAVLWAWSRTANPGVLKRLRKADRDRVALLVDREARGQTLEKYSIWKTYGMI